MKVLSDNETELTTLLNSKEVQKMKNQSLEEADLEAVFLLFEKICNSEDTLVFELKGFNESFQFIFDDLHFGVIFENGFCKISRDMIKWPGVTFRIRKAVVLEILTGQVYSAVAHMNGDIDYTGFKNQAVRFMGILETVLDEILNS